MIKHIVTWKLKDDIDKSAVTKNIKKELEGLVGKVENLLSAEVNIDKSGDTLMLDSTLTSFEALKEYQAHPEHVKAADTFVRPYAAQRISVDYEY